ncbi:MAG: CocE/NonD family hydrolase [Myxococcota bacterium]
MELQATQQGALRARRGPGVTRSALRGLALLVLALGLSGCDLSADGFSLPFFRFIDPTPGAELSADDVEVKVRIPGFARASRVKLFLDGERIDGEDIETGRRKLLTTLDGLESGAHRLDAVYRWRFFFFFPIKLHVWTRFDVFEGLDIAVRESVEQLHVTHADPETELELRNAAGEVVDTGTTDSLGSLVFRLIEPGDGYRIVSVASSARTGPLSVWSEEESLPAPDFYTSQTLEPGYGYITTRDGTKLSVFVSLPGPIEEGPYPTLVNYSGYTPSRPDTSLDLPGVDLEGLCSVFATLCNPPDHPAGLIGGVMGYASVGINMRGTGCSGGAYDFFETMQVLDGYDVIEVIASQDWVLHNKVGMAGISFPGISQLFVAQSRPPGLAAITPLSVIASTANSTLAPGGILNNGFAIEWATRVLDRAAPYGQGWEQTRVDEGDTVCEENQLLHDQRVDILAKARNNPYYTPEIQDPIDPKSFVDQIEVPVFTAGAWQDEQTGGHFATFWDRFTGSPVTRFTGYNGAHADGYLPQILAEWKAFLDLYVAREVPSVDPVVRQIAPLLFQVLLGVPVGIPEDRFDGFASYEEALAAYESEEDVRIIYESGGTPLGPGIPEGTFEVFLDSWPPQDVTPTRWYFNADGSLREFPPVESESGSRFRHDPDKGQETFDVQGPFEVPIPNHTWHPWTADRQAVFVSDELDEDLVMLGSASVDLWLQSNADDADIEVLLSEVRPDGQERYVQSGWLRASQRALSKESTELRPVHTHLEADAAPLPEGEWSDVRVEIFPFAHVFRAGSRIRIAVTTPGGNRPLWKFETLEYDGEVEHAVSHSATHASSVVLPVLDGVVPPEELPACPSLRSQPCREYVPHVNASFE